MYQQKQTADEFVALLMHAMCHIHQGSVTIVKQDDQVIQLTTVETATCAIPTSEDLSAPYNQRMPA